MGTGLIQHRIKPVPRGLGTRPESGQNKTDIQRIDEAVAVHVGGVAVRIAGADHLQGHGPQLARRAVDAPKHRAPIRVHDTDTYLSDGLWTRNNSPVSSVGALCYTRFGQPGGVAGRRSN